MIKVFLVALLAALPAAACAGSASTEAGGRANDRQARSDTGGGTVPASMRIHGRVLLAQSGRTTVVTDTTPPGTRPHDPIPGATVRVRRNSLVNGVATQEVVAEVTTDAAGRYDVPRLPGGYYVVYADPPARAAAELAASHQLVPLAADAEVNVYLGVMEQFEPPPDTNPNWNRETRIAALEAFRGERPATDARWTVHTVEGQPIHYALHAERGRAVLERDNRRDGGEVRRYELVSLELVRFVPSTWANNVEVAKEYLLPVEPAEARARQARYLLRGRCAAGACEQTF